MKNLTRTQLVLIAAGGSIAVLAGAYLFQALGYAPCKLCWWQRYPHFAAVAIGALALGVPGRLLPWLGAVTMTVSSLLGVYHTGIERKWWDGPASCTSSGIEGLSTEELLNQIMAAPVVLCDEIPWRLSDLIPWQVLDITMANFNVLGSALFALIWVMAARR